MRLFVSIDFPVDVCEELYTLVPNLPGWRKTPAGRIHLTLFFIGECSEKDREMISGRLSTIRFSPFDLFISGFGVFPHSKKPSVLWLGVQENPGLLELHSSVCKNIGMFGEKTGTQIYKPHITLARRKAATEKAEPIKKRLKIGFEPVRVQISRFFLKQSVLKPTGSIHYSLQTFEAVTN